MDNKEDKGELQALLREKKESKFNMDNNNWGEFTEPHKGDDTFDAEKVYPERKKTGSNDHYVGD